MSVEPRRYIIIGSGHRAQVYIDAILSDCARYAELVAICDSNPRRAEYHLERACQKGHDVGFVEPADLSGAIQSLGIDRVVITTPDFLHARYIDSALRAGADVVVEKPLTIDADGVRVIAAAVAETGREVLVTFNYRYSPRNAAVRRVVQSGAIGEVTSVHFEWLLDTAHGADYFRRWHREKANSGGLLIHKASHHFDLVNWWIGDSPRRVFASGGLRFYGDVNAARRGLGPRPVRGTHEGNHDPWELDLRSDQRLERLYLHAESVDGYERDRDVFSAGITIEDTLSVIVDYDGGAIMSYSMIAYSPWEGYRVAITGTEGRVELEVVERAAVLLDGDQVIDPSLVGNTRGPDESRREGERLVLQRHWQGAQEVPIVSGTGGHGGGDSLMLSDVFAGPGDDPLGRPSTWIDGVRAVAVGIAGNLSLVSDRPVQIDDLELGVDVKRLHPHRG